MPDEKDPPPLAENSKLVSAGEKAFGACKLCSENVEAGHGPSGRDWVLFRLVLLVVGFSALVGGSLAAGPGQDDADCLPGPAICSWRVGPCLVYLDGEPMRISVHRNDRALFAERARAHGTSLEFRTSSGWHSLMTLKSARRAPGDASSGTEGPLVLEADAASGASVLVTIRWSSAHGALELGWELSGADVLAVRGDFVTMPGERFHGVTRGSPLRFVSETDAEESARRVLWVLSSRSYALGVRASRGGIRAFFPDPDALRVEALGPALELVLLPGEPRSTLPRIRSYPSLCAPAGGSVHEGPARLETPASAAATGAAKRAKSGGSGSRGSSGVWLRLPSLPDRDWREAVLREFRRREFPTPALCIQRGSSEGTLLERWDGSGTPVAPASMPPPRTSLRPPGDWGELARSVRRVLRRSLTGSPEWIVISRRVLEGVSPPARERPAPADAPVGPLPRLPDPELALRLLAVAATQPILCVDWPAGETRFEIEEDAAGILRHYFLLNAALRRLAEALSGDDAERALPLWRPVFVEAPQDAVAWEARDQWLYGPDVMIVPVLSAGVTRRVAYFPAGTWVSAGREEPERVVRGPKRELIDIPPGGIGLFERRGGRFGLSRYLGTAETRTAETRRAQRPRREEKEERKEGEEEDGRRGDATRTEQ